MSSRRSRLDIEFGVLEAVQKGKHKRTQIMFHVNIDWEKTSAYLERLMALQLIEEKTVNRGKHPRKEYYLTEKGREALSLWKTFATIMSNHLSHRVVE